MAKRLVDRFPLHGRVEILLPDEYWYPGQVIAHDHPGVWVRTDDGRAWFVTNSRRIRPEGESRDA